MTGNQQIRVSRELYARALHDASDWQSSILDTHNPVMGAVTSCCAPGSRCATYELERQWLIRYQRALRSLQRRAE